MSFDKNMSANASYTPEYVMLLIKKDIGLFGSIPEECLTYEICMEAVKHTRPCVGGTVLEQIPDKFVTQELCNIAFKTSCASYLQIPDRFKTKEMIMFLAEHFPRTLPNELPEKFNTPEFIEEMLKVIPIKGNYDIMKRWYEKIHPKTSL